MSAANDVERCAVQESDLLGRVYSASRFVSREIGPLGATIAGLVAEFWEIRTMFAIGALASILALFIFIKCNLSTMLQSFDEANS